MKIFRGLLVAVFVFGIAGCRECSVIDDQGNPDRYIRLLDEEDNNLWFGSDAVYDATEVRFEHENKGLLETSVDSSSRSVIIKFPTTDNTAEEITMHLDSNTTHTLTYNTLAFINNECEREYTLSYVKLNGVQVCGSCGNTQFNDDRYIKLRI